MVKQATDAIVTAFQQQKDKALHPIHICVVLTKPSTFSRGYCSFHPKFPV